MFNQKNRINIGLQASYFILSKGQVAYFVGDNLKLSSDLKGLWFDFLTSPV